jgi:hypothetical protein
MQECHFCVIFISFAALAFLLNSGVAAADVEAALMARSLCDGQGLLGLTADDLVALQLPTPALRLLHSSLDALRYFM